MIYEPSQTLQKVDIGHIRPQPDQTLSPLNDIQLDQICQDVVQIAQKNHDLEHHQASIHLTGFDFFMKGS